MARTSGVAIAASSSTSRIEVIEASVGLIGISFTVARASLTKASRTCGSTRSYRRTRRASMFQRVSIVSAPFLGLLVAIGAGVLILGWLRWVPRWPRYGLRLVAP